MKGIMENSKNIWHRIKGIMVVSKKVTWTYGHQQWFDSLFPIQKAAIISFLKRTNLSDDLLTKLKYSGGCPCSRSCCDKPKPYCPHECSSSCEAECDDFFVTKCRSCNRTCCCDL
jgi:hypothetical protein